MGKWVKCSERMPEAKRCVFVTDGTIVSRDRTHWDYASDNWATRFLMADIVAWYDDNDAPPEPPEEKGNQIAIDRYWLMEIAQTIEYALAPGVSLEFVLRQVRQAQNQLSDALAPDRYVCGPRCQWCMVYDR